MPVVHFLGKILPEGIAHVSVGHEPVINWADPEHQLEMAFIIHVQDSQIDVECRLNRFLETDLDNIHNRAVDLARGTVDLVGFAMACGLVVVLDRFVGPDGTIHPLVNQNVTLEPLSTAVNLGSNFDQLHKIILQDTALRWALKDLMDSISIPHVCTVNCGRVMDALRHLIAGPGVDEKQGWRKMREALRIDEAYLRYITSRAVKPRHAEPIDTPGQETVELTRRSWIIMNRYLEFRKRGSAPLPISEFPLLAG